MSINTATGVPAALNNQTNGSQLTGIYGEIVEPDLLRKSLAYAVRRTAVRCDLTLVQHLEGAISPARLSALACVGANPGMSQAALGALLGIAGPSVFKVVDDLEQRALLHRTSGPDRRSSALHLTEEGQANLKSFEKAVAQCECEIAELLTDEERAQLLNLLGKVGVMAPSE